MSPVLATDHRTDDAHLAIVGGDLPPIPPAKGRSISSSGAPAGWDTVELRIAAQTFVSTQEERIRTENRLRLTWKDGGYGPDFNARYAPMADALLAVEKVTRRALRDTYRATVSPAVREWQESTPGIGDHTLACLLGVIGDPCVKVLHRWEGEGADRVLLVADPEWRTVAELWSYCGHGDPTRRKRKGMSADEAFTLGSPRAKVVTYMLAEACMKNRTSPYRAVYDDARARYADREGWTPGHQNAAALRLVGKTILKDLWRVRHAEISADGQATPDAHDRPADGAPSAHPTTVGPTSTSPPSDGHPSEVAA